MYIKYKSERGSMAVYVTAVLLTMLIILTSLYMTTSSVRKSQLTAAVMIKKAYESDNNNAEKIYASLTGGSSSGGQEQPEEPKLEYVTNGLELHYDAINNTGTGHSDTTTTWKDLSGNGNDATITGGKWSYDHLSFTSSNSSNGVKTNNAFPIDFSAKTFNIVFNLSKVSSVEALFGARTSTSDGFMLFNYDKNNALNLDTIGSQTRINLGNRLSVNRNYNLTVTLDNGTVKSYIDGVLIASTNYTTGTLNFPLTVFTAGTRSNSLGNVYSVKVYNRALTADEVMQNYNMDQKRFETKYVADGLLLHYDAINNTGVGHSDTTTIWKDLSGNGNDGTFSTAPTTSTFYWEENCITLSNNSSSLSSYVDTPVNLNGKERTIIYTVDANGLTGSIWGDTDNKNMNGLFNYQSFITKRGTSSNNQAKYDFNFNRAGIYTYAVTLSSSQMQFYQNGSLVATINNAVGLTTNNNIRLLAARYSNQNARNLKMYNFMIYERVLSDNEIQNNYEIIKSEYGF